MSFAAAMDITSCLLSLPLWVLRVCGSDARITENPQKQTIFVLCGIGISRVGIVFHGEVKWHFSFAWLIGRSPPFFFLCSGGWVEIVR
jgi:hypothetical protein